MKFGMLEDFFRVLFLRLYAATLCSNSKPAPEVAWRIALNQLGVLMGVAYMVLVTVLLSLIRRDAMHDGHFRQEVVFSLVVFAVAFRFWARRRLDKYVVNPAAADPYRSKKSVQTIRVLYYAAPLALVLLLTWAMSVISVL